MITNANLYSESYNVVETFLKTITDPKKRYKVNWIHASMPEINSAKFEGYPFMVLQIDMFEDNYMFDTSKSQKNFRAKITVYSDQPTDIETICDSIAEKIKIRTNLTDLQSRTLSSSPISWTLDMKGKKVLFRELNLEFKKRI